MPLRGICGQPQALAADAESKSELSCLDVASIVCRDDLTAAVPLRRQLLVPTPCEAEASGGRGPIRKHIFCPRLSVAL